MGGSTVIKHFYWLAYRYSDSGGDIEMAIRIFNKDVDLVKFNTLTATGGAIFATFVAPTHSHFLAKAIFLQAAQKQGISKKARDELLAIADAVTNAKYIMHCWQANPQKGLSAIGEAIHTEFGHNVEAQRAINEVLRTKPYWKFWRKKFEASLKHLYPEIAESEW